MNAFAGIRPNFPRGSKPDPLAFFPGVCSGGYLFSSGGPTPTTPRQFIPCSGVIKGYGNLSEILASRKRIVL